MVSEMSVVFSIARLAKGRVKTVKRIKAIANIKRYSTEIWPLFSLSITSPERTFYKQHHQITIDNRY